ncbi:hypothetical protein GCM10027048_05500 [Hymenobacter coalescens]
MARTALAQTSPYYTVSVSPAGPLNLCAGSVQTLTATVTSPGFALGAGFNSTVKGVALQPDGKIVAVGPFSAYDGAAVRNVARLLPDGRLDTGFSITGTGFNDEVNSVEVQADGKILVQGSFTSYNGVACERLARLNADGSLDGSFSCTGLNPGGFIFGVAPQADGKLIIWGTFTSYRGTPRNYIARLNADGSLDASFATTGTGLDNGLNTVALQADGKIVVAGAFTQYNGTPRPSVARLNPDGTLDAAFAPSNTGLTTSLHTLAVQPDGRILVADQGTIVRFHPDGSRDNSFGLTGTGLNNWPTELAVQPDGKLLVGGQFTSYNGTPRQYLARLNSDGSLDPSFVTPGSGLNNIVNDLRLQPDGKVLVAGGFTTFNGASANRFVRLNPDGSLNSAAAPLSAAAFVWNTGATTPSITVRAGGTYTVTVVALGSSVTAAPVVVTLPAITGITPTVGGPGTLVTLTGTDLGGVTTVRIGPATATFTINSPTQITATVPNTISGPVIISAGCGSGTGPVAFTVPSAGDLTISSATALPAATYNNIDVTSTGTLTLTGNTQVSGVLTVQPGATLNTNSFELSGTGSFTLAPGATLNLTNAQGISATGPSGAVQVTGLRSFSPDANYVYSGTTAQVTGPGLPEQVRSLTTSNPVGLTLSGPTAVARVLTVAGAGDLNLNGQPLTLLSTAASTALVVNSGTGQVRGPATVQRAISPTASPGRGSRYYSTPVGGATLATLATPGFAPVFNPLYNSAPQPLSVVPRPTVLGYDQSRLATVTSNLTPFQQGYFSPASATESWAPGRGFAVSIPATEKVSFTGTLSTGDYPLALARGTGPNAASAGWHLVGNPYPAPLDWERVLPADRPNLEAAVYVFESTAPDSGVYRSYVNGVGTAGPVLPLGQAFFVRVLQGQTSGALVFRNSQRVTSFDVQPPFNRQLDLRPQVQLSLRHNGGGGGGGGGDVFSTYVERNATAGFDADLDASKILNTTLVNLSAPTSTGVELSIQGLPAFADGTVVPLVVRVPGPGTGLISREALLNLPANLTPYLEDAAAGQQINLLQTASYSFNVTAAQAAGPITGRFSLRFRGLPQAARPGFWPPEAVVLHPNPADEQAHVWVPAVPGTSRVHLTLINQLGQVVRQQEMPLAATGSWLTVDLQGLRNGLYTLRLRAGHAFVAKRLLIR